MTRGFGWSRPSCVVGDQEQFIPSRSTSVTIGQTASMQFNYDTAATITVTGWSGIPIGVANTGRTDVLGLVANNDVIINHRVNGSGVNQAGSLTNPRVDAAVLALDHSFYVQNWNRGAPLGNLTINGVITQEFRGAVGTFSGNPPVIQTGHNKVYTYDTRLKYLSPPYFLSPTLSAWQRISFCEIIPTATP